VVSRRVRRIALAPLLGGLATGLAASPAHARCDAILPQSAASRTAVRPIDADDLVGLRDIGLPDGSILGGASPLGVSPDGRHVAFVVSRADPVGNSYCRALVVLDLDRKAPPRILDRGGEPILGKGNYRGLVVRTGFPDVVTPRWSPDGRFIAYRRRDDGTTQVWLVAAGGGQARALARSPVDVERFAWRPDGRGIVFASRPGLLAERAADKAEAGRGFHYGDRFVPMMRSRPQPSAAVALETFTLSLSDGSVEPAPAIEKARLLRVGSDERTVTAPDGRRAWLERRETSPLSPSDLRATTADGRAVTCPRKICTGTITGLWWLTGGSLLFLQREGWAKSDMVLYRWTPGAGPPRAILSTTDVLDGCVLASTRLLCTREGPRRPRYLALIDPLSGRSRVLYDPNPEFRHLRLGTVTRLFWRNKIGLEARGDLVLPPGYKPGTRLPLIVTQYFSNGFLRGGTGDEYPIYLFAARGFAVLSLERPTFFATTDPTLKTYEDVNAANARGWGERRSLLSAVDVGVQKVIAMGIADPARVGITGLSDGASTVAFALINDKRFAAAAMSSCCLEPWTIMTVVGPAYARRMRTLGYPPATAEDRPFWGPASIARNAATIDTPLLLQLSDDEYLMSLEAYTALKEHGKPVDMYVFPGEHHIKWQPAHRRAIYERNLDWFDFWLRERVDPDPAKAGQYARWRALREPRPTLRPRSEE
jgi:dipeptidyl aminopeptidase/acylaminoacyl peptidase